MEKNMMLCGLWYSKKKNLIWIVFICNRWGIDLHEVGITRNAEGEEEIRQSIYNRVSYRFCCAIFVTKHKTTYGSFSFLFA